MNLLLKHCSKGIRLRCRARVRDGVTLKDESEFEKVFSTSLNSLVPQEQIVHF